MTEDTSGHQIAQPRDPAAPGGGAMCLLIGSAAGLAMASAFFTVGFRLADFAIIQAITLLSLILLVRGDIARKRDASASWLALVTTFAVGPIGAIGTGVLAVLMRFQRPDIGLLDDWYERISLATEEDPITRLCDDVSVGRTMNLSDAVPKSFHATVNVGGLTNRQSVLGLIARRFHPEYLPILREALVSPQPVVRVQAAAVAAHIRPTLAADFRACLDEIPLAAEDPARALALLHRINLALASGLLDSGHEKRGAALADRLGDVITSQVGRSFPTRLLKSLAQSRTSTATLEHLLLSRQRFAELRMLRSALRAHESRFHVRVRRLPQAQPLAGAAE